MKVNQPDFAASILDPSLAVPRGLSDPQGRPAGKRFLIYRNNVAVSLSEALATAFPVVNKLVGDEFFKAMAGVFLRQHPPPSPLMMFYGAEMPGFLLQFDPVSHLGYLPDTARLELSLRGTYHAADAEPIAPETLQTIPADRLMSAKLEIAPSVRLVASDWPILSIWQANTTDGSPAPQMQSETVLITRPEYDPVPMLVTPGGLAFIESLQNGLRLAEAIDAAGDGFNLSRILSDLFTGGAITKIIE